MANTKISDLTALTSAASGDLLAIVDVSDTTMASSGTTKKISVDNVANYLRGAANTFTNTQTISISDTTALGVIVSMPNGTNRNAMRVDYDGVTYMRYLASPAFNVLSIYAIDNGTSFGPYVEIENNNNASTPAPGAIKLKQADGGNSTLYFDNSGLLRTSGSLPTNSTITSGTVIGDQTSFAASKILDDGIPTPAESLQYIVDAAQKALRRFRYRNGAYNGEEFPVGLVTDYAPRYGMDRDQEHPQGKSLNIITAIGDIFNAIAELSRRLDALESRK